MKNKLIAEQNKYELRVYKNRDNIGLEKKNTDKICNQREKEKLLPEIR